jgi:hypothetical protein
MQQCPEPRSTKILRVAASESTTNALLAGIASAWAHLRETHPELPAHLVDGLQTLRLANATLRVAHRAHDGFLALEMVKLQAGDAWEFFALKLPDDSGRLGWRRQGNHADREPGCFAAAAAHLKIEGDAYARADVTFLGLVGAFSASGPVQVDARDLAEREALQEEVDHLQQLTRDQAKALRLANSIIAAKSQGAGDEPAPARVWAMADLPEWAAENADRILILPRVIAEAKRSAYRDPDRFYAALDLLAVTYPAVKSSMLPREELKRKADEIGIFIGGSVDPSRAGAEGDQYFVRYNRRKVFLDQHVGAGTSRDTRFAMRLYWFWDETTQRVVVGGGPSHLDNSLT